MKKRCALLMVVLLTVILTACRSDSSINIDVPLESDETEQFFAMDTIMSISARGFSVAEAISEAKEEIYRLESLLSVTDPGSDIATINSETGHAVIVSNDTAAIVTKANEMANLTGGAFNIAMYPILRSWGFTTGDYSIPSEDTLSELLSNIDYSKISVKADTVTLPQGMEIDVGGIAKGYACDAVKEIIVNKGIKTAIINLGGDVQLVGSRPNGSAWRIAIQDPNGDGYLGTISAIDKAVITSGSYERYFVGADGKTYHHIMDPATGRPAQSGLLSVTVVSDSAYKADALATALFVMGREKAIELWREQGDFELLMMTTRGDVYITEGLEDSFEISADYSGANVNVVSK